MSFVWLNLVWFNLGWLNLMDNYLFPLQSLTTSFFNYLIIAFLN